MAGWKRVFQTIRKTAEQRVSRSRQRINHLLSFSDLTAPQGFVFSIFPLRCGLGLTCATRAPVRKVARSRKAIADHGVAPHVVSGDAFETARISESGR